MNQGAALLSRTKQANGGAAWDRVRTLFTRYVIQEGGLEGTLEEWSDLNDGRFVLRYRLGINSGAEGWNGRQAWSADASGLARLEEGEEQRLASVNQAYLAARGYWFPERHPAAIEEIQPPASGGLVVRLTPAGGRPLEFSIDPATWLLKAITEARAYDTRTIELGDYRTVEGLRIPFAATFTTGDRAFDRRCSLVEVTLNPALDDGFADIPAPKATADSGLDLHQRNAGLSFASPANLVVIEAAINGSSPLQFILDTGGANIITPNAAERLNLGWSGAVRAVAAGPETVSTGFTRVGRLQAGPAWLRDAIFRVYPFADLSGALGLDRFAGILGYEFFARFIVTIDYARKVVRFNHPEDALVPAGGKIAPFRFHRNVPEVDGYLDQIPAQFHVDTGCSSAVVLYAPFVTRHRLQEKFDILKRQTARGAAGGAFPMETIRMTRLQVGPLTVINPVVTVPLSAAGAFRSPYGAGIVGAGVLHRYRLILDYPHRRLLFEER